ncbi:hypothetical protein Cob_v008684 [Colletotrichum orbiculare MAFF 240422]|uniref:Uncharacterized protein n=1 Tax=Colletotrichum orbiculare (strain 104-T / ATCC 96160 / CBS 514.97 / LARS 414 / MAFF 240422) TaxID=1213857 RepID=A0A484FJ64_COLOR|nr:hypothetical protein Cob_v008684 [Colletotrichum orbiculare MAFF 240422]
MTNRYQLASSHREYTYKTGRNTSSPADTVLPSCEPNDDPAFSFSATSPDDGRSTPAYLRGDSLPASSLPARLKTGSLVSADQKPVSLQRLAPRNYDQ